MYVTATPFCTALQAVSVGGYWFDADDMRLYFSDIRKVGDIGEDMNMS